MKRKTKKKLTGAAIAALGILIFLETEGYVKIDFLKFWPLALVIIGLWMALN